MTESLATGTYEVLRNRLRQAADELRLRFERLNHDRAAVFGTISTALLGTAHVTTSHNCIPRDLLSLGDRLLLGYNVQFGLKTGVNCDDVFAMYRLEGEIARPQPLDELNNADFLRDFQELYRYYKHTSFARFYHQGPLVYFVFQVGQTASDIKAFKWTTEGQTLRYIDARSDADVRFPPQYAFHWKRATREQHRAGLHPHISIDDSVFVECVGGDLTIKVEDNTEDGSGIYAEPVDNPDQTLDDAEIYFCVISNLILLKIRPYQEKEFRYLVFSSKQQRAMRFDAIAQSCVLLPDDQGIIFPGGLVLQSGAHKQFDHGLSNLLYEQTIASPNGEDYLYLFTDPQTGSYLQLRYNLIRQEVDTPLISHGQALFEDGQMVTFRGQDTPQKHHALQLWQTPFVGPNFQTPVTTDSMLYKIGNRELVRGLAECQELLQLIDKDDSYAELYVDLAKRANDVLDNYFWIGKQETQQLSQPIEKIRDAATAAVEEFDKVVRLRRDTAQQLHQVEHDTEAILNSSGRFAFNSVTDFVAHIAALRQQRGRAIGLRELRYIDLPVVDALEARLAEAADRLGHRCVQFLLTPESLTPYRQRIVTAESDMQSIATAADGRQQQHTLDQIGGDLELLIETVSQLNIDDLTQRTAIVDRTGDLMAELNRVRSALKAHVRELFSGEMQAEFASQLKLLDQAAGGALDTADTPEKVDEALTRMMLQLEELDGRFAEFDELLLRLTEKRESLYQAFAARRQHLVEMRSRRAETLATAATRILDGISSRALRLADEEALRSYFVSDPMVGKVRQIAEQLQSLGDTVRMDDVLSKLKTVADDSLRQLRDRHDLFTGVAGQIRLGRHTFNVNRQSIELTCVARDGELQLHLTGTQFYSPLHDPALEQARDLWQQILPSESPELYRGEFLARVLYDQLKSSQQHPEQQHPEQQHPEQQQPEQQQPEQQQPEQAGNDGPENGPVPDQPWKSDGRAWLNLDHEQRVGLVRTAMQARHDEGYSRGVHDRDAAMIITQLLQLDRQLDLLRYAPEVRGTAWFIWQRMIPPAARDQTQRWIDGFSTIAKILPSATASQAYVLRLRSLVTNHAERLVSTSDESHLRVMAEYLFEQLQRGQQRVASPTALRTLQRLHSHLPDNLRTKLQQALVANLEQPLAAWTLALDAVDGYLRSLPVDEQSQLDPLRGYRHELAGLLLCDDPPALPGPDAPVALGLQALAGDHPRIAAKSMAFHYHEFMQRTNKYVHQVLPRFIALRQAKHRLLLQAQQQLRIDEFRPSVLTSFVRNKLIDEVYLPLIGDNLAKQIGAAGENKRSDRMGLLLLVSPPGYGKTTLMEYIANRLGLVFVKVNGPALGHQVTSLDPSEATNASAREEVRRINFALEMGDNVMLYLDDIQHCHTELLQKFIPLCDATRRIEGVWEGQAKTYDLRGRKVVVVMAGNPYTESGQRFQIPDMLSNRADVYNLGEIIGEARDAFELSYIENCLTSNEYLQPLTRVSSQDQRALVRAAQAGSIESLELQGSLSPDQVSDAVAVLAKLLIVRDAILKVNRTYIQSAAQVDAYRTEPPFKLQGSYRNMNRIAQRVVPVMNDAELRSLIASSYEQDAQTLTSDGESNLLKFKELTNTLTTAELERWENIKYAFVESVRRQGIEGEDKAAQVLRSLAGLRDGLESIRRTIAQATDQPDQP